MSNYCLTLLDSNKNQVWGMNPGENIVGYVVIGQYSPILLSKMMLVLRIL